MLSVFFTDICVCIAEVNIPEVSSIDVEVVVLVNTSEVIS